MALVLAIFALYIRLPPQRITTKHAMKTSL